MSASFRVQCFCAPESVTPLLYGLAAGMAGIDVEMKRMPISHAEDEREHQRDQIMRAIPRMREDGWDQILLGYPLCERPVHFAGIHREGTLVSGLMNCFTLLPDGEVEGQDTRLMSVIITLNRIITNGKHAWYGRPALVVGDGGCAIAAAAACSRKRMLVTVANLHGSGLMTMRTRSHQVHEPPGEFDLVINAGGEGYARGTSFPAAYHRGGTVALDLLCCPAESAFCRDARRKEAQAYGGVSVKALQVMGFVNALTGATLKLEEYLPAAERLLLERHG